MRSLEREQEIAAVADLEQSLVSAHLQEYGSAQPWIAPSPDPVDRASIMKQHEQSEFEGTSVFKRADRKAAKQRAIERAEEEALAEEARRAGEQESRQAELDSAWQALTSNDPEVVLQMLEHAFADNEAPAAAVDCSEDQITVLMLAPDPALIPERKPAVTAGGKPTLKKRTKAERNELYISTVASNVLATIKESFAVAPRIHSAVIAVLRKEASAGLGPDRMHVIFCGTFSRELLDGVDWHGIDLARVLDEVPDALIKRKGQAGDLQPLDLASEPELDRVLRATEAALEDET